MQKLWLWYLLWDKTMRLSDQSRQYLAGWMRVSTIRWQCVKQKPKRQPKPTFGYFNMKSKTGSTGFTQRFNIINRISDHKVAIKICPVREEQYLNYLEL